MLTITNPERVTLGTPERLGEYGSKISTLIKNYNAIAGVNAGGFSDENGKGRGGTPTGIIIEDGDIKYVDKSIERFNIIGFNKDNILVIGQYSLEEVENLNLRDAVNFRPFLILNGKPVKMYGNGGWGTAPRTAIGQKSDGTVLLVVIDGRQLHSAGATMKQMQDIMVENGAVNAANLDGGSSSVMQLGDKIINSPSSPYGDRYLPSAFLINGEGLADGDIINKTDK
jgi:exopolysaccharide biosynthesis protein